MLSEREVSAAIGSTAYGDGGGKLGTVEHFYVDDRTGQPTWVAVTTGLFGTRHSIAPVQGATWADGRLQLPVSADAVKNAPAVSGNHLDPREEEELRRHYGLATAAAPPPASASGTAGTASAGDTVAIPATPPVPDGPAPRPAAPAAADGAMTRSEEQLRVSTQRVPERRVRVVKYVVTEEVQVTVPIRREEIRIEEVPLEAGEGVAGDDGQAGGTPRRGAPAAGGLPEEIILHTERPVVTVEVVPVERVRLRTELVQGQETVSGQVRREQVVVDQDPVTGTPGREGLPRA